MVLALLRSIFMRRTRRASVGTSLVTSREGLRISPLKGEPAAVFIPWSDVVKAVVFKRDLFTTDDVCMLLELKNGTVAEINENMPGWQDFVETLSAHLPGTIPWSEWFTRVAFPAFEANPTVVFTRVAG